MPQFWIKNCFNFRIWLTEGNNGIIFKILPDFDQNLNKIKQKWGNFENNFRIYGR